MAALKSSAPASADRAPFEIMPHCAPERFQ
jgi:hypothetical protein